MISLLYTVEEFAALTDAPQADLVGVWCDGRIRLVQGRRATKLISWEKWREMIEEEAHEL